MIMMQKCKDNMLEKKRNTDLEWIFEDIQEHQSKMEAILLENETNG